MRRVIIDVATLKASDRGVSPKRALETSTLTARELADRLDVREEEIVRLGERGAILRIDGRYPSWQVHGKHTLPGLGRTLLVLGFLSPTAKVRFFLSRSQHLGGMRPLDWLRSGKDIEEVEIAARQFAGK